jgi:purine/pyrimidine-nucleoside phosphorylase
MSQAPGKFDGVSVVTKANVYFDGKVVSHTVNFPDGSKKTVGLIYPGSFTFTTAAAEVMAIVAGACRVRLKGESGWKDYAAGTAFSVPANSAFDVAVESGIAEYVCSFG